MTKLQVDEIEYNRLKKLENSAQKRYKRQNDHIKENYKRASVTIKNDIFNIVNDNVLCNGISLNSYINNLILEDIKKYNTSAVDQPKTEQKEIAQPVQEEKLEQKQIDPSWDDLPFH